VRCATGYAHSASGFPESNSPKVLLVVIAAKSDERPQPSWRDWHQGNVSARAADRRTADGHRRRLLIVSIEAHESATNTTGGAN
jgi:hypothetical protein